MRTIYKYPLETIDEQVIEVPMLDICIEDNDDFRQQFLYIDTQHTFPCMWCIVDTDQPKRKVKLKIVGSGNPISDFLNKSDYLGSYQSLNGNFIGHVFLESVE